MYLEQLITPALKPAFSRVGSVGRQAPPPSLEVLGFSQAKKPLFKINILFNQLNMI